jgi:hypothetical protein
LITKILEKYPCERECKFIQGSSSTTMAYYMPMYDKNGVNTNPDRNTTRSKYSCTVCGKCFNISSQYGEDPDITVG